MRARRLRLAARAVDVAERILDRHRLWAAGLHVGLDPAEAGEEVAGLARQEVRAVELGGDMDGEVELPPQRLDPRLIGNRAGEVAAEPDEGLRAAVEHCLARFDGVPALLARGL